VSATDSSGAWEFPHELRQMRGTLVNQLTDAATCIVSNQGVKLQIEDEHGVALARFALT
jgi:hypothetical protein